MCVLFSNYYMISNIISLCFRFQHGGFRTVTRCYCFCCCCLECEMVSPSFHSQTPKCQAWHWRWVGAHTRWKNKDRLQCVRIHKWSFHGISEGIRWLCYSCHVTTDGYLNCQQADSVRSRGVMTSCLYKRFFFYSVIEQCFSYLLSKQKHARTHIWSKVWRPQAGSSQMGSPHSVRFRSYSPKNRDRHKSVQGEPHPSTPSPSPSSWYHLLWTQI